MRQLDRVRQPVLLVVMVAGFLLFRLFDITKPGPVGWADRRNDAMGVMLDDVIAGVFAAIGVLVLAGIAHGVMGL